MEEGLDDVICSAKIGVHAKSRRLEDLPLAARRRCPEDPTLKPARAGASQARVLGKKGDSGFERSRQVGKSFRDVRLNCEQDQKGVLWVLE